MPSLRNRRYVLAGLLVVVGLLAAAILWEVVESVFFAITVAYVLYPLRERLVDHGAPKRLASGLVTALAFLVVIALLAPLVWALFERRSDIVQLLRNLPDELTLDVAGFAYVVDVASIAASTNAALKQLAFDLAANSLSLVLELSMFTIVLYGLLLRPNAVGHAVYEMTPTEYHDVITALHRRVAGTLYALYVIQAATAVVTFPVAFLVFFLLGYEDAFVLSVVAAVLQFIPIVGPGFLAVGLGVADFLGGMTGRAIAVVVLGPVVVGLLPDLVVRPQLATRSANLPVSLYFVGFTGGVLTLGVIGVIAGPLVVALLAEVIELLSDRPTVAEAG